MKTESQIQNILNRSVRGWRNITLKEFERDIKWLQSEVKKLNSENDYLKERLKKEVRFSDKMLETWTMVSNAGK